VVIAYIPEEQTALKSAFTELASRNRDRFTFGLVTDKSLAQVETVQVPSVVVHKPREGEQEVLPGPSGIDALERFLETATAPPIGEFTRRNELKYMKASVALLSSKAFRLTIQFQAGKSLVYYFAHKPQDLDIYRENLKPLAKKFKEYLNFVTVNALEYGHMLPALGLQDTGSPALAVFNPMYGQAFPLDQKKKITPDVVESFVMDIVQGKVQPLGSGGAGENTKHTEL
jgi:protein disulfide-isomerase A1